MPLQKSKPRTTTKAGSSVAGKVKTKQSATQASPKTFEPASSPQSTSSSLTPPSSPPRATQNTQKTLVPETSQSSSYESSSYQPASSSQTVIASQKSLKRKRIGSVDTIAEDEEVLNGSMNEEDGGANDEDDDWDPASWTKSAIGTTAKKEEKKDNPELGQDGDVDEVPFVVTQLPLSYQNVNDKPGLLVKKERNYFPAYLVDFHPAQSRDEDDIYMIVQHAVTKKQGPQRVKRKQIVLLEDEELADCPLAIIDTKAKQFHSDARTRAATPLADNDETDLPPAAFAELERWKQLRQIRSHLQSIINEEYEPALPRIKQFFKSDKSRQAMSRMIVYGDIPVAEAKDVILPELERWAMRDERFTESELVDKLELDPIRPPTGSDRYEALTTEEKRKFITLVLQPEAIIQLTILSYSPQYLLESAKARTSPLVKDIPDIEVEDVGEKLLYLLAKDHLEELSAGSDISIWASIDDDIKDARKAMRERLGLPAEGKSKTELELEGRIGKEMGWASGRYTKKVDYSGDGTKSKK